VEGALLLRCDYSHTLRATRYVETEQKTGNVVLVVSSDRGT